MSNPQETTYSCAWARGEGSGMWAAAHHNCLHGPSWLHGRSVADVMTALLFNSCPSCTQCSLAIFCTSGNSVLAFMTQIWLCPTQGLPKCQSQSPMSHIALPMGGTASQKNARGAAIPMPGILCTLGGKNASGILCDSDEELSWCGADLCTLLPCICPQPWTQLQQHETVLLDESQLRSHLCIFPAFHSTFLLSIFVLQWVGDCKGTSSGCLSFKDKLCP